MPAEMSRGFGGHQNLHPVRSCRWDMRRRTLKLQDLFQGGGPKEGPEVDAVVHGRGGRILHVLVEHHRSPGAALDMCILELPRQPQLCPRLCRATAIRLGRLSIQLISQSHIFQPPRADQMPDSARQSQHHIQRFTERLETFMRSSFSDSNVRNCCVLLDPVHPMFYHSSDVVNMYSEPI